MLIFTKSPNLKSLFTKFKSLQQCSASNKNERKGKCNGRVMNVEQCFTPLVLDNEIEMSKSLLTVH